MIACIEGMIACIEGMIAYIEGMIACIEGMIACIEGMIACIEGMIAYTEGTIACIVGAKSHFPLILHLQQTSLRLNCYKSFKKDPSMYMHLYKYVGVHF